MYNPQLKSEGAETEDEDKKDRPKVMSPWRLTYEQKFEKFVMSNLERKLLEQQQVPEEERPDFDLQILNNETSVNIKAMRLWEKSVNDLKRRVDEMVYSRDAHAVPGHDEIIA